MRSEDIPLLEHSLASEEHRPCASIIAPLDNLLWDRKQLSELFGFDYRWEVYKPQVERDFGYYVLPVLYCDRFIARFEPGRDKKNKSLIIKNWWWESGVKPGKAMHKQLAECFRSFMEYLGTVSIDASESLRGPDFSWLEEF